jgi:hypothetical protein
MTSKAPAIRPSRRAGWLAADIQRRAVEAFTMATSVDCHSCSTVNIRCLVSPRISQATWAWM